MKYALTFAGNTAGYRLHAQGCKMAATIERTNTHLIPLQFESVEAARAFADADESEKAGETVKADFKICKCAKPAKAGA